MGPPSKKNTGSLRQRPGFFLLHTHFPTNEFLAFRIPITFTLTAIRLVGNGLGGLFAAGEHFADVEEEFVYGVVGNYDCGGGYDQDAAEDFTAGNGLPENGHTERYG